jgi:sulfotransferase family protein
MKSVLPKVKTILHRIFSKVNETTIISYPKSGRTWLRVMFADLGIYPRFSHKQTKFSSLRMPHEVHQGLEKLFDRRIIFLQRDPRDIVVSAFFYYKYNKEDHSLDFKDFIRAPQMGFEKIVAFNTFVLNHKDSFAAFLPITYEEMQSDTKKIVSDCLDFMSVSFISEREIQETVRNNTFESMQRKEKSGELLEQYGDSFFSQSEATSVDSLKTRRGKIGGYVDYMDAEDLKFCQQIMDDYKNK